jgi:hypothetical protein
MPSLQGVFAYTLSLGEAGETLTFPAGSVPDGTTVSVDRRVDHTFSFVFITPEPRVE